MVQQELEELRLKEKALVESIRCRIKSEEPECKVVYLPVPMANAKVDYILIAMEPSFRHWAKTEGEAEEKVQKGFRSFIKSWDDFAFLYSVSQFLSPSYYVTDVSKAAMKVKDANKYRECIYRESVQYLQEEINIVGKPDSEILCVGRAVHAFLKDRMPGVVGKSPLLHYSGQAARERKRIAERNKDEYAAFKRQFENDLTPSNVLAFADNYMKKHDVPVEMRVYILEALARNKTGLSESRKQLMYAYYRDFTLIKGTTRPT